MLQILPYLGLAAFVGVLVYLATYWKSNAIELSDEGWESLVASLRQVELSGMKLVAGAYLNPQPGQIKLEPEEMWNLVEGYYGLRKMNQNAELMLALAAFAKHWNYDEATIVSEQMRRDALRLRSAARKIRWSMMTHSWKLKYTMYVPFHLQEATAAYYLMHERLLALYKTSHEGRYPLLAAALG